MSEVTTAPAGNGAAPASMPDAEKIVSDLRALIADRERQRDELLARIEVVTSELKAYEKSLAPLIVDPMAKPGPKKKQKKEDGAANKSVVGAERMAEYEAVIISMGQELGEFRPTDFRERTGVRSGVATNVFHALRERNVIRFARAEGNSRYFRLTRPAEREAEADAS